MSRKLISFDYALKRILREKANFEILEGFLSELLKFDLKIEEILESESNKEYESNKYNRVDLLVKNSNSELILIELQHDSEFDYFHRMLYGTSKLISQYINKGKGYLQVKKVYSINIVYFDLGQGFDYLYYGKTEFRGMNHTEDILLLSKKQKDNLSKNYPYEREYYIIKVNKFNDIAKNTIDEWIYFLKNEEVKDSFKARGLEEAKSKLDIMKLSKREQLIYKRLEEDKMLEISVMDTARIEGKIEGIKEGEKQAKLEIAKKLLSKNTDIETISELTNLSPEEINKLLNS
jgi:predicted transposase/invertase (TIGR01784 family)